MRYHARPISFETVNTEKLVYRIHDRCSFSPSDVIATLEELKYEVAQCLKEGKKVHINGLGYLQITLSCEEEIRDPKAKRVHKVKLKAVKFKADKELKAELSDMHFQRSKYKPHSASLSEEEIDKKLTAYFATHPVLTRSNMQSLCSFTQSMASRQIRRLKAKGNLQNIGKPTQPIYIPTPGHYEK